MSSNRITCIQGSTKRELHRAGWIIIDSSTIVENGYLEIENGSIIGIHKGRTEETCIDHGPGVLMPPLVNAHVHLELSALKGRLPFDKGFKTWVETLLKERADIGEEKLIKDARKAVKDLLTSGNLYVGDISTLGIMRPIIKASALGGVCFNEFLGSDIPLESVQKNDVLAFSLAGHGPHTTSPQLLGILKKQSKSEGLPFSIHVAESDDESMFIQDKKGKWAEFLTSRGIDWSSWDIGSKTPVHYIADLGLLDSLTLVVHLLNVNQKDLEIIAQSRARVCVCPRSNQNLHGKLPDIDGMIKKGIHPALGTDSLASCNSLDILDEMIFVRKKYPGLYPETIFSMGTINGARALGIEQFAGSLSPGKRALFLYRPIKAINKRQLLQRIISK